MKESSSKVLEQKNKKLEAKVKELQAEIDLLRKSFLPNENYYKDRFYKINENVNDVVYRFRIKERKYEYISPQVKSMLGYYPEEFYNNPSLIRHLIHPDFIDIYFEQWRNILKGKVPEYFEIKIINKSGDVRWIMQKNLAITDEKGEVSVIECIITDITGRMKVEEALREAEAQKKAILNNLPHLAWLKDCNGVYLSVNESFAARISKTVEDVIGTNDFDCYSEEEAKRYRSEDLHVIINKKQLYIEEKTGDTYWETFKAPIFNDAGDVIGITGIALEISERKAAEEEVKSFSEKLAVQNVKLKLINDELSSAKDRAEQADKLKSAFLANMSHEIRTPMNAILGFATLLRDRKLNEEKQKEFINLINTNCRQLLHIISDIIDISKIEANQINIYNKNFNVNNVLEDLEKTFNEQVVAVRKSINVKRNCKLKDEEAQIFTDKVRLQQVLSNLLSNAVKFTDEGEIELGYYIEKTKNEIVFYVKDTGIGMTEAEQGVIFDRFRQVSSAYNKMYGGTGLGLSICKGLAERLGGEIWVKSEVESGSTFYISIPFKQGAKKKPEKIAYNTLYNWKGKVILIAEDEKANFSLLDNVILPTHAKVIWAKNGLEAIDHVKENRDIDLVLMDIKMPDMNGLEATKRIRKLNKTLPIIAQTAFAMPNDEDNCIKAGCNDYLSKPLKVEEILNKINNYIHLVKHTEKNKLNTIDEAQHN